MSRNRSIRLAREVLSTRYLNVDEVVNRIEVTARTSAVQRRRSGPPPITRVRLIQRLLSGFHPPLRENAVTTLVLRRLGHAADLVIGYEPIPETTRHRRLFAWVEVDGVPMGTSLPAHTYLQELIRFPHQERHEHVQV